MTDHRKTAVYIRLSAEDDNVDGRAKKESDSVTSQRILLKSFVIDQLGVAEADSLEYVDDGVSGTHFKRQGFQQLQDDMKSGEIGCVVVKDFSRFGRDYLEVGFYIEYIFPLLQIRLANRLLFRNICRISKQVLSRLHLVTFLITGLWEESL